jgi:hypothetical protein
MRNWSVLDNAIEAQRPCSLAYPVGDACCVWMQFAGRAGKIAGTTGEQVHSIIYIAVGRSYTLAEK